MHSPRKLAVAAGDADSCAAGGGEGDLERRKPPVAKLRVAAAVAQCVVLGRLSSPSIKADY